MPITPPDLSILSLTTTTAQLSWVFVLGGAGTVMITFVDQNTNIPLFYTGLDNPGSQTFTGLLANTPYIVYANGDIGNPQLSVSFTTLPLLNNGNNVKRGSVRVSKTAPLQNGAPCQACTDSANGPPIIQYSSASELIEYKRRRALQQSYTNTQNIFPIKNRYASLYTSIKRGASSPETCCPSTNNSGITGRSDGKAGPAFLDHKLIPS